jgi:hypothetical protein
VRFGENEGTQTSEWRAHPAPSRTFDDAAGVTWEVVEVPSEDVPGAQGDTSLLFLSDEAVRRVWRYPSDWHSLSAKELESLSWRR